MRHPLVIVCALALGASVAAQAPKPPAPAAKPAAPAATVKTPVFRIETAKGVMVVETYPMAAPKSF